MKNYLSDSDRFAFNSSSFPEKSPLAGSFLLKNGHISTVPVKNQVFGIMIDDCTLQYSGKRCTNVNFTINLDERLTFSTPVEFPISNGEAAMRKGYKLWSMLDCEDMIKRHYGKMFRVTSFRGDMKKDELIVRRDNGNKEHGKERVFKKVTKDFVVKNYTKELVTNEMVKMYDEYYQEEDLYE